MELQHADHSLMIDHEKCTGCVVCTLACPVHAIRIRNGKALVFKDKLCIDCGECLRVCPHQAIKSLTSKAKDTTGFKVIVALPSPVLYAQFSETVTPNDILLALLQCGFDYVYDVALSCEMTLIAMDEYMRQHTDIRPLISNYCPAVARLIVKNYPDLIENIIRVEVPRELAAKHIRKKIAAEKGVAPDEIGIFHITPCAAKMVSIKNPLGVAKSNLDGAIAIRDLYRPILNALKDLRDDFILQNSSGVGINWAIGRSSIRGLPHRSCVAVTSVKDIIKILDDVEAGRLSKIDYLECSICPGGCVGGPLAVQNRHIASKIVENLTEQYGVRSRLDPRKVLRHYETDYLISGVNLESQPPEPLDQNLAKAAQKMNQIETISDLLPGKNCGACGAPNCRTLAEDVVMGAAQLADCVFMRIKELENEIKTNRSGSGVENLQRGRTS